MIGADLGPVPNISIVLPAYNEEGNVESAVTGAVAAAEGLGLTCEVVVVDDGSTDGTGEVLRELHAVVDELRIETHAVNRGYGCALRTGFAVSRADLILYTDSDNQFVLGELSRFLPMIDMNDMVVGYRIKRADPRPRLLAAWVYNRMVDALFHTRVRDVDCAFKLMRRNALESMELVSDEFFIDTEMIAKGRALGMRIAEVGVTHLPRTSGQTTVRASHVFHTLRDMRAMWAPLRSCRRT